MMSRRSGPALLLAVLAAHALYAHQQPATLVMLDMTPDRVAMRLHVPLNELELAFGHETTRQPEARLREWEPDFRRYLQEHVQAHSASGEPWQVRMLDMTTGNGRQAQSGPFEEVQVNLALVPPAGADVRSFLLKYDVILHQVVTHKAVVTVDTDWDGGRFETVPAGVIAVDTGTGRVEPLAIQLGGGSLWAGFRGMIALGMRHIREGTDHLLFLLVLLLPATVRAERGSWGGFGGSRYGLMRVVRIVTAFTIGHSITLLAGALQWLRLPQQPVEIAIAASILVTAIHAIRPIFPQREAVIAGGFGFVHGLGFAAALAGMHLAGGRLAASILGFNLGIEAMQIWVLALAMPWLIVLSFTPVHRWVRTGGALVAATAAMGWIWNRVTGESNGIEKWMEILAGYAPLGILLLAGIAIPACILSRSGNGAFKGSVRNEA